MFDDVRPIWSLLLEDGVAAQRIIEGHSLRLYYGSDAVSNAMFFLITAAKPEVPELSSVVSVERGQRADGNWTLVLTLRDRDLTDTFMSLCLELARSSAVTGDPILALDLFFEALQQWRVLLRAQRTRLSAEELRGLVAELAFGLKYLGGSFSLAEVLLAWAGPHGMPQDYRLASGELFEVKSVRTGGRTIEISSADQLDPFGSDPLGLAILTVDESVPNALGAVTVISLLDALRAALIASPDSLDLLDRKLEALQFDAVDDHYERRYFTISSPRLFHVTPTFPRVLRSSVPAAIDKLTYRLRLAGISQYEVIPVAGELWLPTSEETNG